MVNLKIVNESGEVEELNVKFWSFFKLYVLSVLVLTGIGYAVGFTLGLLLVILGY